MTVAVHLAPTAAAQIEEARNWWLDNRQAARSLFDDELERAVRLVGTLPDAGQLVQSRRHPKLRRLLTGRTRYHLYYVHNPDGVEVVAFWHASRGSRPPL